MQVGQAERVQTLEEDEVGERGCVVRISSGSSLAFSVLERVLLLLLFAIEMVMDGGGEVEVSAGGC